MRRGYSTAVLWLVGLLGIAGVLHAQNAREAAAAAAKAAKAEQELTKFGCLLHARLSPTVQAAVPRPKGLPQAKGKMPESVRVVDVVKFPAKTTDEDVDRLLPFLMDLPEVQTLDFGATQITPATLAKIVQLASLEGLFLGGTKIAETTKSLEESFDLLGKLPRLNWLDLGKITAPLPSDFSGLRLLQTLTVYGYAFDDVAAGELGKFERLHTLTVNSSKLTDVGIHEMRKVRFVSLDVSSSRASFADAGPLEGWSDLTDLRVSYGIVNDKGLANIIPLKNLKLLALSGNATLTFVEATDAKNNWKHLERLLVDSTDLGDEELENLLPLQKLKVLVAGNTKVSFRQLKNSRLVSESKLETLSLANCPLDDASLREIARIRTLRDLNISGITMNEKVAKAVALSDQLTSLNVSNSEFSNKELMALTKSKSLISVFAFKTKVDKAGADAFRRAVPKCTVYFEDTQWKAGPPGVVVPKVGYKQ